MSVFRISPITRVLTTRPLFLAARTIRPAGSALLNQIRPLTSTTKMAAPVDGSFDKPVATLDTSIAPRLPDVCHTLFSAKKAKKISFEHIAKALGREEVAVAAIFYGQAKASEADAEKLAELLGLDVAQLKLDLYSWPDRGRATEMPPREPLIYRLYEIVQNYGAPIKAVLNEKFGDGIMSAISFSCNIKKETDDKGDWAVITLRGKWLPYTRF